ncbi:MAG: GGDEF domain-containing protein [Spirochaetales bacterium]|nr:GGDEF domain-containing protein [Spirochaetales bacterium]
MTEERLKIMLATCRREVAALLTRNLQLEATLQEHEDHERELLKRLYLDEKTGFPNHAYMYKDCRHLFSDRATLSGGDRRAIIFIALDETFELLKKSEASIVSEWVLYKIAHWIKDIIGSRGKVYHSRDTEFAVILHRVQNVDECTDIADRISSKMSEIHRFPGHHITVACHIGFAVYPDHGMDAGTLLRSADIALSECRKNNYAYAMFTYEMAEALMERIDLKNGILRALEEQAIEEIESQFELCFQPLIKVASLSRSNTVRQVIGSECLLRWNHPLMGPISPGRFIPLAEESGLIIPIGNWVLYNATQHLVDFQKHTANRLYMSVNLSPKQFYDPYLIENLERVLRTRGIDPTAIQLEITETSMMDDPQDARRKCDAIQAMGMRISIDDFGTGYSSLSYLKNLRVDSLKIDKSFIDDVVTNNQNQGIVRAVISMARSLGMDILAEGVEDYDQLEFIHKEGCSKIQGYYFSKPLKSAEFISYLSAAG